MQHGGHITKDLLGPRGAPVGGGGAVDYHTYIEETIAPLLWLRFQETSGNAANSGSLGGEGTVSACTQGEAGAFADSEAYTFNGATSIVSFALPEGLASLTTQRWAFLCRPTGLGELSIGTLFAYGNGPDSPEPSIFLAPNNRLAVNFYTNSSDPVAITANNEVDFLNYWAWVFVDYDNGNELGLGRRIRIFRGLAGSVRLLTLAVNNAAWGTFSPPTLALSIGNRAATYTTFAGKIDEVICSSGLWTPTADPTDLSIMEKIVNMTIPL